MIWKIYKRFLVGLVVTILASSGIFALAFADEWHDRVKNLVKERVLAVRDVIGGLYSDGLSPDTVARRVRPLLDEHKARASIFSSDGKLVYHFDSSRAPEEDEPEWSAEVAAAARNAGFYVALPRRDTAILAAAPIAIAGHPNGLLMIVARPPQWVKSKSLQRGFLMVIVLLGASFVISFVVARALARPVVSLTQTVERFGAGSLDARATVHGTDELALLGNGFNRMAERIGTLLADKRRLLADVSHELKTPLARLRLSLELARQGATPEAEKFLQKADAQTAELASLIDELSLFSRLEAAPYEAEKRMLDVAGVIRAEADRCGAERFELAVEAAVIPLDRRLFERALGNVLKNAVQHAPGVITVRGRNLGSEYEVEVEDRGPGVPAAEQARIFEPFYRTDTARARDTGGTGLGLAIAKRCMEAHAGEIKAVTAPGGGLKVMLTFPAA